MPEPEATPFTSRKNPIVAAILSLFPGVGNLYNGLYMRGLAFFLICTSMIILTATQEPLFGLGIASTTATPRIWESTSLRSSPAPARAA